MLDWAQREQEICARIEQKPAILKVLLKTKDDPFFLAQWIDHHLGIVGPGNIIIFDNGSTNPEVLAIYDHFAGAVEPILFSGYHNSLHYTNRVPSLYAALYRSSQFFVFLDTDEFLVIFEDDGFYRDGRILELLGANSCVNVFPTTWLYNTDWSATRFRCGRDSLVSGLTWGKPILRSKANLNEFINHNVQLDKTIYGPRFLLDFFVFHMAQLNPRQRILTNVNKLVACRFAARGETAEEIAVRDLSDITDSNIIAWVDEIRRHLAMQDPPRAGAAVLRPGCLELIEDRSIVYFSELERQLMREFVASPEVFCRTALNIT
jgi:hypothetical protein